MSKTHPKSVLLYTTVSANSITGTPKGIEWQKEFSILRSELAKPPSR